MIALCSLGVEQNRYQEFVRGQDILHFSLEQVQVQGIQVQVHEFLTGKSRGNFHFSQLL